MAHSDALPITAGPSKFDIQASLFTGQSVTFTAGHIWSAILLMVEAEDGSLESWNFQGFMIDGSRRQVKGCFNSKKRTGHIFILAPIA